MKKYLKLLLMPLMVFVLLYIAACSQNKLEISPVKVIENQGREELNFTAINKGAQGYCNADISIIKENSVFSKRTIKLGLMESNKKINVIDKIEFPEGDSSIQVEGYCS